MKHGVFSSTRRARLIDEAALREEPDPPEDRGAGLAVFAIERSPPTSAPAWIMWSVADVGGGAGRGQRLLIRQVLDTSRPVAPRRPENVVERNTVLSP